MDQQPSNDPTAAASSEKFVTTPLVIIFITIFIDLIGAANSGNSACGHDSLFPEAKVATLTRRTSTASFSAIEQRLCAIVCSNVV
jgi:hypothetical protein